MHGEAARAVEVDTALRGAGQQQGIGVDFQVAALVVQADAAARLQGNRLAGRGRGQQNRLGAGGPIQYRAASNQTDIAMGTAQASEHHVSRGLQSQVTGDHQAASALPEVSPGDLQAQRTCTDGTGERQVTRGLKPLRLAHGLKTPKRGDITKAGRRHMDGAGGRGGFVGLDLGDDAGIDVKSIVACADALRLYGQGARAHDDVGGARGGCIKHRPDGAEGHAAVAAEQSGQSDVATGAQAGSASGDHHHAVVLQNMTRHVEVDQSGADLTGQPGLAL